MEKHLIQLRNEFLTRGLSKPFEEIFEKTKGLLKLGKYYDPSGALDYSDFEQIARIGLNDALISWEPGAGSTLISWIRMKMSQNLIREIRRMPDNQSFISLDNSQVMDENWEIERVIFQELSNTGLYNSTSRLWDDELYWRIVKEVRSKLDYNLKIERAFLLKMAFPDMSREKTSQILGVTRCAVSNYFAIIKNLIADASRNQIIYET